MPLISIIIPSWTGEITRLRESIARQTLKNIELQVVRGVSPAARARNVGASRAKGDILLFIDDDAYLGSAITIETLVKLLETNLSIAISGSSKLVPPAATSFQKAVARQVPRMIYPVEPVDLESNPPLEGYGYTAVTTTCCAVRREVFEQVGGFDETLLTGEDTEFFYRVRRNGYRLFIAGNCWVYHDPPSGISILLRKSFKYGIGHALEARKNPQRGMAVLPLDRWYGKLFLAALPLALPVAFFVHYYFDQERKLVFGFRPLKTLSTYATLCGYGYGWFRGSPVPSLKTTRTYLGRQRSPDAEKETPPEPETQN